jgi:hypothetical protein
MRTIQKLSTLWLISLFSATVYAQSPSLQLQSITQNRLTNPTFVTNANDGSGRMFVLEQAGRIMVVGPSGSASVFLDLTEKVMTSTERGLLGLAFHPQFAENSRFFVDYTRKPDGAIVVAEYHVSSSNPGVANTQESAILTIPHPAPEHNGGMLAFGADRYLYISVGDAGTANDPANHAQDPNSLLGKILRVDIDHRDPSGGGYSSPGTNPFYGSKAGRDEIYALGFRNPWRFSFDSVTDELYVGDVGQDAVEEIDVVELGGNYGWRVFEGWLCTNLGPAPCNMDNYISPIHTYVHTGRAGRCSVTGGYVYRGNKQTLPFGAYIFGDYCTGEILMFYRGEEKLLIDTTKRITSFGVDEDGEIYAVGGTVDRIVNTGGPFTPATTFNISGGGVLSLDTPGEADELTIRHAQIHANDEDTKPTGVAFIAQRTDGILVNEAAVPATSLIERGRLYAEIGSSINTGVAIANPDMARAATISFEFTDAEGNSFAADPLRIPPGGQFASFLNQDPFNAPEAFNGTVTFTSSIPVSVVALRGLVNERFDFLTTTLPVIDLETTSQDPVIVPQLAAGGGWTTDVILMNPTDGVLTGSVRFLSPAGESQEVTVDGTAVTAMTYSIAGKSSRRLPATGPSSTTTGSVFITPDSSQTAPFAAAIYAYKTAAVTVSTSGFIARPPAQDLDIYSQLEGEPGQIGSVQTGVSIVNPTNAATEVNYELVQLDGSSSGVSGKLTLPPNGQRLTFVHELPGAASLNRPFRGVLRLFSSAPISALAIHGRYNERGEFLLSTTPPTDPASSKESSKFIPHVVDGAGYSTEIVIYDVAGNPISGSIYFFDQNGEPIDPDLLQAAGLSLP